MLNFLKEIPDKYLLFAIFLLVFGTYLYFQNDFLATLSRDLVVAILTILGVRRHQVQAGDVTAENVEIKEN